MLDPLTRYCLIVLALLGFFTLGTTGCQSWLYVHGSGADAPGPGDAEGSGSQSPDTNIPDGGDTAAGSDPGFKGDDAGCAAGQRLCSSSCALCPEGVGETACNGDICVATTCLEGYDLQAGTCRRWRVEQLAEADDSVYTSVVVGTDGRLHVIYNGLDSVTYSLRLPGGGLTHENVSNLSNASCTSVLVDGNGQLHAGFTAGTGSRFAYHAVREVGPPPAWDHSEIHSSGAASCSRLVLGPSGAVYAGLYSSTEGLVFATAADPAWQNDVVEYVAKPSGHHSLGLAVGGDGRIHLSYYDQEHERLRYAYFSANWVISTIADSHDCGSFSSLAVDSHNKPHVVFYDHTAGDLVYATLETSGWQQQALKSAGDVGAFCSLALAANDAAYVAFYNATYGDLELIYQRDGIWQSTTVAHQGDVGRFSSLVLDTTGEPHLVYFDASQKAVFYAYRE